MNSDSLAMIAVPFMFSWIAWVIFSTIRRYKIAKLQAEVQSRLLDKVGSGQELLAYAQTEAGKSLLESLSVERPSPYGRIFNALQIGIILVLVGAALLFLRSHLPDAPDGVRDVFLVFGTLITVLGVGFGLSATASYYLSKSLGLLNGRRA